MRSPFFNESQKRLRAPWRLAAYVAVLCVCSFAASWVCGLFGLPGLAHPSFTLLSFAALWLAGKALDRRPFKAFGFSLDAKWWTDLGFGFALGAVLMAAVFAAEFSLGFVRVVGFPGDRLNSGFARYAGQAFLFFLGVSAQEELFARAYLMRNLAEGLSLKPTLAKPALWSAYAISSSLFGVLHAWNPNASLSSALLLILAGFFLGLPFFLSGEMAIPLGLHFSWNFFQGVVFGFPVSGTTPVNSFMSVRLEGPEWITGGAFGPEGGLIGAIAMGLGSGLILLRFRLGRGPLCPRWDLASYSAAERASPASRESEPPS